MDDQFGGRTDDDLFADEFEAVNVAAPPPSAVPVTKEASHHPPEAPQVHPEPPTEAPAAPAAPAPHRPSALMQSRHAPQPGSSNQQQNQNQNQNQNQSQDQNQNQRQQRPPRNRKQQRSPKPNNRKPATPAAATEPADTAAAPSSTSAPANAPTGPSAATTGSNTAGPNRHLSGANPRTKLTSDELAAKMDQMRIKNAEKTRKFEQAEQDSRSHAVAYEKGMEERRKKRAEEAERKKRGEENQRKLDEEREKNRARKLKAMGSWDQEKGAEQQQPEERRDFRGANGGRRRFNERAGDSDNGPREFGSGEFGGRGGRGGRGPRGNGPRGGRNGRGENDRPKNGTQTKPAAPQAVPKDTDFPALPPSNAPPTKLDTTSKPVERSELPIYSAGPNSPPIGKWDEEMEAYDDKAAASLQNASTS
ncbi:hypothetical protein PG999_005007 [Apiospora kogelbergensis]|uniref:Uncharacterized protein n=1 Tax=Apiospora kogelbergensis TaxID=1337665 RepID=A0AAW0R101_9PEZI